MYLPPDHDDHHYKSPINIRPFFSFIYNKICLLSFTVKTFFDNLTNSIIINFYYIPQHLK